MGRSLSNAKTVSAFITNRISDVIARRGYAAASGASESTTLRSGAPNLVLNKDSTQISWVPDPVTGYYRPENQVKQVDAAELRAMLANNTIRRN